MDFINALPAAVKNTISATAARTQTARRSGRPSRPAARPMPTGHCKRPTGGTRLSMYCGSSGMGLFQADCRAKQAQRGYERPREQLALAFEFLHRVRGLFEPIDLRINLLQRIGIRRPVEFPPGLGGDLLQGHLVQSAGIMTICLLPKASVTGIGASPRTRHRSCTPSRRAPSRPRRP